MLSNIPPYFLNRGLDHFSPSQGTMNLDKYVYSYLLCSQEKRRKFKNNSKMRCGVLAGEVLEAVLTDTKPPALTYTDYIQWDDMEDKEQWENDKNLIMDTVNQALRGLKLLNINPGDKMVFENYVNYTDDSLVLPIIGRTDIQTPNKIVELKTMWTKKNKRKKDGTRSFSIPKLKDLPDDKHMMQASFYHHATQLPTWILQVVPNDFRLFEVTAYDYKQALHNLINNLKIKQEVAKLDEPQKVVQPDFTHFTWNIGDQFKKEAKEMYGY